MSTREFTVRDHRIFQQLTFCACCLLGVSATIALADEPPASAFKPNQLLVLQTGKVISGQISRNASGYVVDLPTGSMVIDEKQVKFVAENRADAYRKMSDVVDTSTADGHIALANWCMQNGFHDEAAKELRSALQTEPSRGDARRMLTRLEELMHPESPIHKTPERTSPKLLDGYEAVEVKSLGGLSREAATGYMAKVQPILLNRCALAGCHGPKDQNAFRLERIIRGQSTHRLVSDRNLARVLQYVDPENPSSSRVLKIPNGPHGKDSQPVFSGTLAASQYKTLAAWVELVAGETEKGRRAAAARPSLAHAQTSVAEKKSGKSNGKIQQVSGTAEQTFEANAKPDLLEKVLREERPDPFDPGEFNKRFHSGRAPRTSLD
jgi:hypothetical protein